jgi:hypothetical protein
MTQMTQIRMLFKKTDRQRRSPPDDEGKVQPANTRMKTPRLACWLHLTLVIAER